MGFYIRKALRVGPLRFNLSKSGIGVSAGIKGLRFGTGPRGNYVHIGRGGLYFRKSLNAPGRSSALPVGTPQPIHLPDTIDTVGPIEDIDSGSVLDMVDASSAELLNELNKKRKRSRILPVAIVLSLATLLVLVLTGAHPLFLAFTTPLAIGVCWWVSMKDALRKTTVILYKLEADAEHAYERLHNAFDQTLSCARIWHIEASGEVRDRKYHAGASALVKRKLAILTKGTPPFVKTNVEVPLIPVGRQTLAFMPDRLLIFDTNAVGAVSYPGLILDVAKSQFIEEESVPRDATVISKTWRYVNKKGGPDHRFKNNPEIPICVYEQLHFQSTTGLNEVIQLSKCGPGAMLKAALSSISHLGTDERTSTAI